MPTHASATIAPRSRCHRSFVTYPGGVGEGTQRCAISHPRRLRASNVPGTGPMRAPWPAHATRKKAGKRCATMRTTPSFHTWRRSNDIMSYKLLLSVAKPQTAPMAGTNASALCSVRSWPRRDGRGSRSRTIALSSCASRTAVTSQAAAPTPSGPPATSRRATQWEQKNSHALPIRQTTERSPKGISHALKPVPKTMWERRNWSSRSQSPSDDRYGSSGGIPRKRGYECEKRLNARGLRDTGEALRPVSSSAIAVATMIQLINTVHSN